MNLHTRRDPQPKTGIDCSNPRRRQFVEVQPFAVDPDTGEILNPTGQLVLKEVAPINQDEVIQSYFETSDFKTVLNRIRKGSGEEIPTYDGTGSFIDLTNMPLDSIVKFDSSLSENKCKRLNALLDSIVKFDSSLSATEPLSNSLVLDSIVKFDSSLSAALAY